MKKLLFLIIIVFLFSCGQTFSFLIKKHLNSRFTNIEIVSIEKDSANLNDLFNRSLEMRILTSTTGRDVAQSGLEWVQGKKNKAEHLSYCEEILKNTSDRLAGFEEAVDSKTESCFLVTYRYATGDGKKIEKQEYFSVDKKKYIQGNYASRPVNKQEYLRSIDYDKILDSYLTAYKSFFEDKSFEM
ncbi:MAG: hypothetical protein Q7T72_02985 [Bacteroidales bacterium]|nr:hypothetical protein [Bacteroidales bacterium]MDP3002833.1 hypothetical protein [Bacteroidales bacterium]